MQPKDRLYRENKENTQHKGRKNKKQVAKTMEKSRLRQSGGACSTRADSGDTRQQLQRRRPPGAAKHSLKRRSVTLTRNQRAKTPWRVRTTRRASVKHAAKTSSGRGGWRRGTRLASACQAEVDGCA